MNFINLPDDIILKICCNLKTNNVKELCASSKKLSMGNYVKRSMVFDNTVVRFKSIKSVMRYILLDFPVINKEFVFIIPQAETFFGLNLNNIVHYFKDASSITFTCPEAFSEVFTIDVNKLKNIKQLSISLYNEIKTNISNLDNLIHLELDYNNLKFLPYIHKLNNLKNLSVSGNKLLFISSVINFPNLIMLDLSNNNISRLPCIENLKSLEYFYINNNYIGNVIKLKSNSLKEIDMSHNKIKDFPINISLPKLVTMYINNNLLTTLPLNFNLPNLVTLNMNNNMLTCIPDIKLHKLTNLCVNFNILDSIEHVRNFTNLVNLDLSQNYIHNIPCMNLPHLECLNLDNNFLIEYPEIESNRIITLNLCVNQIETIPNYLPDTLVFLYMSYNRVKYTDTPIISKNLVYTELIYNPCNEYGRMNFISNHRVIYID